jgi:trk system potassium uptake protein TrkA
VANQRQAAVLGLGRFGQSVARELTRLGHEVLAVDRNERIVQELADEVTQAVRADITDGETLRELGIGDFDIVIIGVSGNLEVSILTTVQVKRLGAQRVLAKAAEDLHGLILEQVGADRVIYPERETGVRVAHTYAAGGVRGYLDVAPGYGIARVLVDEQLIGRTLGDVNFSRTYGVTVIALYRGGSVTLSPVSSETLQAGDNLIVAGLDEDLERLPGSL